MNDIEELVESVLVDVVDEDSFRAALRRLEPVSEELVYEMDDPDDGV